MNTYNSFFETTSRNASDIVKYLNLYFGLNISDEDHVFTADEIFMILRDKMKIESFGKCLADYICGKHENINISPENTDALTEYCISRIKSAGLVNSKSIFDTEKPVITSKLLKKQVRNWLGNVSPSRENVFILAFALGMTAEELCGFLTKALRDKNVNYKSCPEVISFYCIKNGYDYAYALTLLEAAKRESKELPARSAANNILTENYRSFFDKIFSDEKLIEYSAALICEAHDPASSLSAEICFKKLLEQLSACAVLDKKIAVETETGVRISSANSVSFGTTERYIYYYTPEKTIPGHYKTESYALYSNGNITGKKENHFKHCKWFFSTLLRRSDLQKMYSNQKRITRDTIITLAFFCVCENNPSCGTYEYIADINEYLNFCRFEQINFSYPYDLFIFMCLQTDDPIASFRMIWNMSWVKQ